MVIQIDSREKARAIKLIEAEFRQQGVQYYTNKLLVGDYMSLDNPRLIIDRKQNLLELCTNVSDVPKKDENGRFKRGQDGQIMSDLARFTRELQRAQELGIKLIILCEHGRGVKTLEDVKQWVNPRLKDSPLAISGMRLYIKLSQLSKTYGFELAFCEKKDTGAEIIRLLGGG